MQILNTDASSKDIGCMLSESSNGSENNETMVLYGSGPLRGAITRYSARHLESFAVPLSLKYLRECLR